MSTPPAPTSGWLTDLTPEQQTGMVGATLNVFWNMRASTGLLLYVTDGIAYLHRPDQTEPIEYQVGGTRFERVPGTPMRPALASALAYEHAWLTRRAGLVDDEFDKLRVGVSQYDYDQALTEYEEGLPDVFSALVTETTCTAFSSPGNSDKEK